LKNLDQLAVYCGWAQGSDPDLAEAAQATAAAMVMGGAIGLVTRH